METILLIAILELFNRCSQLLGSLPYFILTQFSDRGKLGKFIFKLSFKYTKLGIVVRMLGLMIDGFGLIIGYLVFELLFGQPLLYYQWIIIFIQSVLYFLKNTAIIVDVKLFDIHGITELAIKSKLVRGVEKLKKAQLLIAKRSHFAYVNIAHLIRLLASFSIVILSLFKLNILVPTNNISPTLFDCVNLSFSFLGLSVKDSISIDSYLWFAMKFLVAIILLIWVSIFLAFGTSSIEDNSQNS